MDDVEPPASPRLSNGRVDLDGLQEDSEDLISEEIDINQSSSPISDEPGEPRVSVDRSMIDEGPIDLPVSVERPVIEEEPYALQNAQDEEKAEGQEPQDDDCPRIEVSAKDEKSVEETKFSVRENDPAASSSTPSNEDKRIIDTSAPIESVLDAVSKFGGIVNRKAHKTQTPEKSRITEEEIEKAKEEIPVLIQQTEAAEEAKAHALKELEATHRFIEELKLKLERAQAEERHAKQDSELAKLRLKEMKEERGEDLNYVEEEVETLRRECSSLLCEKDAAVKRAEEDLFTSKEIEKAVKVMSVELASAKEALESAYAAHLEAEEQRNGAAMIRAREALERDKKMKQVEEDMEKLRQQVQAEKDLKGKLKAASDLLASLKSELEDYKELKRQRVDYGTGESAKKTKDEAKNELEGLKLKTEKTRDEMRCLKVVFETLNQELDHEKSELASVKQREDTVWMDVSSLKAELERMNTVIAAVQMRKKEAKNRMDELPKELEVASQEADRAKSGAEKAREGLRRAKEEAEQAKERDIAVESLLVALQREIEAAKASEEQAMAAIKALQESESDWTDGCRDPPDEEAVALEEYNELSKRAQEAEEQANAKAAAAMAQVELAREAEMETLSKLEAANEELLTRKEVYEHAAKKAEKENEAKVAAEQELAMWNAENEHKQKDGDGAVDSPRESIEGQDKHTAPPPILTGNKECKGSDSSTSSSPRLSSPDMKAAKKKKKHYLPRFFMLFSKKKTL